MHCIKFIFGNPWRASRLVWDTPGESPAIAPAVAAEGGKKPMSKEEEAAAAAEQTARAARSAEAQAQGEQAKAQEVEEAEAVLGQLEDYSEEEVREVSKKIGAFMQALTDEIKKSATELSDNFDLSSDTGKAFEEKMKNIISNVTARMGPMDKEEKIAKWAVVTPPKPAEIRQLKNMYLKNGTIDVTALLCLIDPSHQSFTIRIYKLLPALLEDEEFRQAADKLPTPEKGKLFTLKLVCDQCLKNMLRPKQETQAALPESTQTTAAKPAESVDSTKKEAPPSEGELKASWDKMGEIFKEMAKDSEIKTAQDFFNAIEGKKIKEHLKNINVALTYDDILIINRAVSADVTEEEKKNFKGKYIENGALKINEFQTALFPKNPAELNIRELAILENLLTSDEDFKKILGQAQLDEENLEVIAQIKICLQTLNEAMMQGGPDLEKINTAFRKYTHTPEYQTLLKNPEDQTTINAFIALSTDPEEKEMLSWAILAYPTPQELDNFAKKNDVPKSTEEIEERTQKGEYTYRDREIANEVLDKAKKAVAAGTAESLEKAVEKMGFMATLEKLIEKLGKLFDKLGSEMEKLFKVKKEKFPRSLVRDATGNEKDFTFSKKLENNIPLIEVKTDNGISLNNIAPVGSKVIKADGQSVEIKAPDPDNRTFIYRGIKPAVKKDAEVKADSVIGQSVGTSFIFQMKDKEGKFFDPSGLLVKGSEEAATASAETAAAAGAAPAAQAAPEQKKETPEQKKQAAIEESLKKIQGEKDISKESLSFALPYIEENELKNAVVKIQENTLEIAGAKYAISLPYLFSLTKIKIDGTLEKGSVEFTRSNLFLERKETMPLKELIAQLETLRTKKADHQIKVGGVDLTFKFIS